MVVAGSMRAALSQPVLRGKVAGRIAICSARATSSSALICACACSSRAFFSASSRVRSVTVVSRMCVCNFNSRNSRSIRSARSQRVSRPSRNAGAIDSKSTRPSKLTINANFLFAATMRSRYSNENTTTTMTSSTRSAAVAQPGSVGIAPTPMDATLSSINPRMRFSKARAYGPGPTSSSATSRCTGPVAGRVGCSVPARVLTGPLPVPSGPAGRFVFTMKAMNGPQVALHQRVLAKRGEDLKAAARGKRARQLRTRAGEVLKLTAVLPQQLAVRHLVLVQFPGCERDGCQPHDKGQLIFERYAEDEPLARGLAEPQQSQDHQEDEAEQGALQPLGSHQAAVQLGHFPDEVLALILDPGQVNHIVRRRAGPGIDAGRGRFKSDQNMADPAKTVEAVYTGERQHLLGVQQVLSSGEPQVELHTQRFRECPAHQVLREPMARVQYVVQGGAQTEDEQVHEQQRARAEEFLVQEIGQAHREGDEVEEGEQPVGVLLEVDGERVGFAVLGINPL